MYSAQYRPWPDRPVRPAPQFGPRRSVDAAMTPTVAGMFTPSAAPPVAPAAPAVRQRPSASASGWSMPGVTAPVFGGPAATTAPPAATRQGPASGTSGWSRVASMVPVLNTALSVVDMVTGNRAANQARYDTRQAQKYAIDLELRRIEEARRNSDLDREEARRLNDRAHELEMRRYELDREQREWERRVYEQQEARLAPRRRMSDAAFSRLSSMWRLT